MCRMRETNYGSVPAECFGPSMARRVRPLLRLQNHVAGQVFLQGSEAILQRGFLQVSNPLLPTFAFAFFFLFFSFPSRDLKRWKNRRLFEFDEFGEGWYSKDMLFESKDIERHYFFSFNVSSVTLILIHSMIFSWKIETNLITVAI